ncbi:hypothetical protein PCASD_00983 [Puccinia coronata f. sp. avenae]|uniref:Uncharacterized protein n=1 Tax=Puccinia coronata f. sp. avenae TaxID=200324 RepID=A0A2N5VMH1_9BASI|nr:hypothetical protein PCASD_00983 [Puccinia coronata f. sp. avenae]
MHEADIGEDAKAVALDELPYKVHDGNPEDFKAIRQRTIQLHAITVPKTTAGVADLVRLGLGVFFQRNMGRQTQYWKHLEELTDAKKTREMYLCHSFGWVQPYSKVAEPALIDEQHVHDPQLLNFSPAQFPVRLPGDMEHEILTVRVPSITDECIRPLEGDVIPEDYQYWQDHIEEVKAFIVAHDYMGSNVPEGEVAEGDFGKFLMPTYKTKETLAKLRVGKYADAEKPKEVKEEVLEEFQGDEYRTIHGFLGLEKDPAHLVSMKGAIRWFTRHIYRILNAQYPGAQYSFFRVSGGVRSNDLEEVHVFLTRPGLPKITAPSEDMLKP